MFRLMVVGYAFRYSQPRLRRVCLNPAVDLLRRSGAKVMAWNLTRGASCAYKNTTCNLEIPLKVPSSSCVVSCSNMMLDRSQRLIRLPHIDQPSLFQTIPKQYAVTLTPCRRGSSDGILHWCQGQSLFSEANRR